jgi:hypothetical protein
MLWRKLKLDWNYAIGELTIVTVGVLIALAVDQWNSDRLAGLEEAAYVSRFITDIDRDIGTLEYRIKLVDQKLESLDRVADQLRSRLVSDNQEFLEDIVIGANFGWNQARANRDTYDDLVGSGRLSIISDHTIRISISAYYKGFEGRGDRIEERETEYPGMTYKLIPRSTRKDGDSSILTVEPSLPPDRVEEIHKNIRDSDFDMLVTAEQNFGRFLMEMSVDQLERARKLRMTLVEYLETLG